MTILIIITNEIANLTTSKIAGSKSQVLMTHLPMLLVHVTGHAKESNLLDQQTVSALFLHPQRQQTDPFPNLSEGGITKCTNPILTIAHVQMLLRVINHVTESNL
jgi:hypothetical protein